MTKYTAVLSSAAEDVRRALEDRFEVIRLPRDPLLQAPVSTHADMLMCAVGDRVFVPRDYYENNKEVFEHLAERCSVNIVADSTERRAEYPHDVLFNVLMTKAHAFGLLSKTAPKIKETLKERGYTLVNVKQGYAACSTLSVGSAVVTADRSVAMGAEKVGVDSLLISPGSIELPGYDCGFIGGATGVCGDTVYFAGELDTHPDGKKIREFLCTHGFNCISLLSGTLKDVGGIKFFKNTAPH